MTLGELLAFAIEVLAKNQIPYAVVGSFASGAWGEPRMTRDIDIVIRLDATQVDCLCEAFSGAEFYINSAAIEEAIRKCRPFNVIHLDSGNKIDFMVISEGGWEKSQLARRIELEFLPNVNGYVAAPEDVILGKLVYYREGHSDKHLRDIVGILRVSDELIDRAYIAEQAEQLQVLDIWQQILDEIAPS